MTEPIEQKHYRRRRIWLSLTAFILGAVLVLAVPLLVRLLNLKVIAGMPLGYYLASQGVFVLLALLAVAYAALTSRYDDRSISGDE